MKAFRQIIKAMFILRHADVVELRRAIERRLSKAEPANCFTQAAAVGIPRGLDHADRVEQEIAESRTRRIRNGIVCWNYLCMTHRLEARCCTDLPGKRAFFLRVAQACRDRNIAKGKPVAEINAQLQGAARPI